MENRIATDLWHPSYRWILIFIFSLQILSLHAQENDRFSADSLFKKIGFYSIKKSPDVLFLHFDKTIYTNSENVWFTAYLFNYKSFTLNNTLSVALIKDDDHSIAIQGLFVMSQGISFGNFFLPDSITPGNYSFVACTNRVIDGKPEVTFIQQVTIKTTDPVNFNASLVLTDTLNQASPTKRILLSVHDKNNVAIIGADIEYKLINNKGSTLLKKTTGLTGQSALDVPAETRIIEAQVKYNKTTKKLKLLLPASQKQVSMKFYPEGGNLINNIPCLIGWEVKTAAGTPMQCTGILYKNNIPADTIYTNASGMGNFELTPKAGFIYSVKLSGKIVTSSYPLPQALSTGTTISVGKALVNDVLNIKLHSSKQGKVYLLIHNYKHVFYLLPIQVSALAPSMVKIDLAPMPKGVAEVTLLDSLQRPLAERLFFAKYDEKHVLDISTNKREYKTREKVTLKLKLNNLGDKKERAIISVACVQSDRIDSKKANNIESYFYLQDEMAIDDAESYRLGLNEENKSYLECLLLIKGWRRYKWTELIKSQATDTVLNYQSVIFNGSITHLGKPIKRSSPVVILHDSLTRLISTNDSGKFLLNRNDLITAENNKIAFFASDEKNYSVNINNPYQEFNKILADKLTENAHQLSGVEQNTELFIMKGLEHAIQLKEVKINADNKENDKTYYQSHYYHSKNCSDWVCQYNVLNCQNHPNGTPPVDGRMYSYHGQNIIYQGCGSESGAKNNKTISQINGIWISKEFYAEDYVKFNPTDPQYLSTIYWKNLLDISSGKETEVSFYTSDITGNFKIIIQGISTEDVIYSTKAFTVKN